MIEIKQETIDACHAEWDGQLPSDRSGNKVAAIKYLRGVTGLGLKETKDIVESDFDTATCKAYDVVCIDNTTPGYHIDRIFELSAELAEHHSALKSMGFSFGGAKC